VSNTRLQAAIPAADIAGPGSASVTVFSPTPGGGTSALLTFSITSDNPVPALNFISPGSALAGGATFTLNLTGLDFASGSVVRWNGSDRPTTFLTHETLQANISTGDLVTGGTFPVTVFNPGPGGGASNPRNFSVNNLVPTLTSISPTGTRPGYPGFTLTVTGTKFVSTSVVRWNGADRSTTFVNPTTLQATIPAGDVALEGTPPVTVFNPAPGGGTSTAKTFTIASWWPVNDNFANAIVVTTTPFTDTVNTTTATTEFTDPTPACSQWKDATVWYRFTPASNATVRMDEQGSSGTIFSAWTGSPGSFTSAGCDWGMSSPAQLSFTATAGTTYSIMISHAYSGRTVVFNLSLGPTLTSLSPSSALAGGAGFTLTVNGSGFIPASVVRWNGADRTTGFNNANQVTADITAADIASPGTAQVTVFNPGSGLSNALSLPITSANDNFANAIVVGSTPFTDSQDTTGATIEATDPSPSCSFNNKDRSVWYQYTPATNGLVTADTFTSNYDTVLSAYTGSPGAFVSKACNDQSGGNQSQISFSVIGGTTYSFMVSDYFTTGGLLVFHLDFQEVANPVPALTTLSPSTKTAGGATFTLTVNGSNFVGNSVVRWDGSDRTTTFVSAAQVTASIPAGDIAAASTANVTVFNPAPGGGASNTLTLSITNPSPSTTSLSPTSTTAGGSGFTLTVNGSGFVPVSVVRWNGSDRTTTYVSSAQLTADIPAADIATADTALVTVFNPAPGGGTSSSRTFTINNPVPAVSSLSPTNANAGGAAFTLTVNGSNFVTGSVVRWKGSSRTTTFVNSGQLTAAILAADIASAGSALVTVFNATPGGGTSTALTFTINALPNATFQGKVKDANKVFQPGVTLGAYQAAVLKFQTTTATDGSYALAVDAGTYDLVASKAGFLNTTKAGMSIAANQTLTGVNFKLFRPSFFQGTVTQKGTSTPIAGALVEAIKGGVTVASTLTAGDGSYSLQVTKGLYTLRASKTGFKTKSKLDQNIGDGTTKTVNIALPLP